MALHPELFTRLFLNPEYNAAGMYVSVLASEVPHEVLVTVSVSTSSVSGVRL